MLTEYINMGIQVLISYATGNLIPFMVISFFLAVILRKVIFFTVRAETVFIGEFEKRVHKHLADPEYEADSPVSFHMLTKRLLERTLEEHYNLKKKYRRRRFDQISTITDRLFMVPEGAKGLISDTLSQTKYLRKGGREPKFLDISRFAFESNPIFNRVAGFFPLGMFHEFLNILPGLFVIGGIFGTFLGVMQALPMLSSIDPTNPDSTKIIMDAFLMKMAFSMGTSVVGIILSVSMTVLNSIMSPDTMYYRAVNRFTSSLEFLWNDSETNEVAADDRERVDRRRVAFASARRNVRKTESLYDAPKEAKLTEMAPSQNPPQPEQAPPVSELLSQEEVVYETPVAVSKQAPASDPSQVSEAAVDPTNTLANWEAEGMSELEVGVEEGGMPNAEVGVNEGGIPELEVGVEEGGMPDAEVGVKEEPISDAEVVVKAEPKTQVKADEDLWETVESIDEPMERTQISDLHATALVGEKEPPSPKPESKAFVPDEFSAGGPPQQLEHMFLKMESAIANLELNQTGEEISAPASTKAVARDVEGLSAGEKELEDQLAVLRHRMQVLDEYLKKADAERLSGNMSEEMWKEEAQRYASEKEELTKKMDALEEEFAHRAA